MHIYFYTHFKINKHLKISSELISNIVNTDSFNTLLESIIVKEKEDPKIKVSENSETHESHSLFLLMKIKLFTIKFKTDPTV